MGRELQLSRPAFASSSGQGAAVECACASACMQAKIGCSENRAQGGSEPGRQGAGRAMTADQVHAAAVVGKCANSGQRGRFAYTCVHILVLLLSSITCPLLICDMWHGQALGWLGRGIIERWQKGWNHSNFDSNAIPATAPPHCYFYTAPPLRIYRII